MKRRRSMLVIAIVLAFIGAIAVYSYLRGADARALAHKQATTVLVAAKRIPAGTTLDKIVSDGYTRTDRVPADAVPEGALTSLSGIANSDAALAELQSGQVVVRDLFGPIAPTTSGLTLPDGMIAVSVTVGADADVAGYVQPGSEVAIFDTFILLADGAPSGSKDGAAKDDNWATKLLLPRVLVLAVSHAVPSQDKPTTTSDSVLVTVAVSQADAERLIHIRQTGMLYLALLTSRSKTTTAGGVDNQGKLGPVFQQAA